MKFNELVRLLEKEGFKIIKEKGLPIPPKSENPKIIVQNEEKLAVAYRGKN